MMSSLEDASMRPAAPITDTPCSVVPLRVSDRTSLLNSSCVIQATSLADENHSRRDSSGSNPSDRLCSTREINYDAVKIKNLLLNQKHVYQIVKNEPMPKAEWWRGFGFPARFNENNVLEKISGFISCLRCMHTMAHSNSSGTRRYKEHVDKCFPASMSSISYSPLHEAPMATQRTLDQVGFYKSVHVNEADVIKIKNLSVEWICGDLRPFSILDDAGLRNLAQECIRLGT